MSEQLAVVDHQQWVDASAEDLYGGDRLTPIVHEHTNEYGQTFRVLVTDGRPEGEGPTILSSFPLDHRINPLSTRRAQIKAKQTGALVAISEIPGVTMDQAHPLRTKGAFQTPEQTVSALGGNLKPIAKTQLDALIEVLGLTDGQEVRIDGESLAADTVAAWLQVIASGELGINLEVTDVNLVEIISRSEKNKVKWARFILKNLMTTEESLRKLYLAENTAIKHDDARPFEQASRANARTQMALRILQSPFSYVPALGVSRSIDSRLQDAMKDPYHDFRDTKFTIFRGDVSSVSDEEHSEHIAETITLAGGHVQRVKLESAKGNSTPVGHAFGFSLGRDADLAVWQKN